MSSLRLTSQYSPEADLVLHEGDCLDLLGTLPDGLVQLVVTSPLYNLGKSYESRLHLEEYLQQQRRVIEQCVRVLSPRGSICWEVGNYVENGEILPLVELVEQLVLALTDEGDWGARSFYRCGLYRDCCADASTQSYRCRDQVRIHRDCQGTHPSGRPGSPMENNLSMISNVCGDTSRQCLCMCSS